MTTLTVPRKTFASFEAYKHGRPATPMSSGRPCFAAGKVVEASRGVRRPPSSCSTLPHPRTLPKITPKRILITVLIAASILTVMLPATKAFGRRSLGSSKRPSAETRSKTISIVVHRGDTLWSIAQRLEPKSDPRKVVDQLVQARGSATVYVGETIEWSR